MIEITKKIFNLVRRCAYVNLTHMNLLVLSLVIFLASESYAIDLILKSDNESSQIELKGRTFWDYQIEKDGDIVRVKLDKLKDSDVEKIINWKTNFIKKVTAKQLDNYTELEIHLAKNNIESFAYQMEAPSRLLIDFYIDPKSQIAEAKKKSTRKSTGKRDRKEEVKEEVSISTRNPASEFIQVGEEAETGVLVEEPRRLGLLDGADPNYQRFVIQDYEINEEAIAASKKKVFIPFPYLYSKLSFLEDLDASAPVYKISDGESTENQRARLLLTMFNNKRYAMFLSGLDIFKRDFASSKYDHLLRFMEADAHYHLWKDLNEHASFTKAIALYKKLLEDYPTSPLYERTRLLVAYATLEKRNYVTALQELLAFKNDLPNSQFIDEVKISIGDMYLAINKFDEALEMYEDVIRTSKSTQNRIKATAKISDTYAKSGDVERNISSIKETVSRYPASIHLEPGVLYNLAESQFRKNEYRDSHENFLSFLKIHSSNEYAPFALNRVGEVLEILTKNEEKIKGAYQENMFRYNNSPGAFVSKMRLMSERMPSMNTNEVAFFEEEVKKFIKTSDIPDIQHLATSLLEDGYYARGDLQKSFDTLLSFYKANVTSPHIPFYRQRIARNISSQIDNKLSKNDYLGALKIYGENYAIWLKDNDRLDLRYNIARTFEKSTAYDTAAGMYRDVLNKIFSMRGTSQEFERQVNENMPIAESVNLRLARVYFEKKRFDRSLEHLRMIDNPELLSENEFYERYGLLADLAIEKSDFQSAEDNLNELVRSWKALPQVVSEPYFKLVDIYNRQGKYNQSKNIIQKIINFYKDSESIDNETYAKALEEMAKINIKQANIDLAIENYTELLTNFDSEKFINARYSLGNLHFEKGDLVRAEEYWTPLKNFEQGEVWFRIAKEKLEEAKWEDNYKNYLNRAPASQ